MCIVCMPGPKEGQKSVSDPLELELLPMVIRCYMGDRNGIQILYKSSLICWAISLDPESNLKMVCYYYPQKHCSLEIFPSITFLLSNYNSHCHFGQKLRVFQGSHQRISRTPMTNVLIQYQESPPRCRWSFVSQLWWWPKCIIIKTMQKRLHFSFMSVATTPKITLRSV